MIILYNESHHIPTGDNSGIYTFWEGNIEGCRPESDITLTEVIPILPDPSLYIRFIIPKLPLTTTKHAIQRRNRTKYSTFKLVYGAISEPSA